MHVLASFLTSLAVVAATLGTAGRAAAQPAPGSCEDTVAATVCGGSEAPEGGLALIRDGRPAAVAVDAGDHAGLRRAVDDLRQDFERVSGQLPPHRAGHAEGRAIIVGTLGHSPLIDRLAGEGRLDTSAIEGEWEAYLHQVVDRPAPGIERALVIAGSDLRGAIYGVYELSRAIGVSPWYWWADVPADRHDTLFVAPGARSDQPSVRYRGIFLNDENPALYGFVHETYGGFNHAFYEDVFELILRLRGNYLWPAMWGKAFYDDDPLNAVMADSYGIVIGTSHHEPLGRAHVEWERYGEGPWDFSRNAGTLREFWRGGMDRIGDNDALVTIGMRGDGDEAMTEGTAIELLEDIVANQRDIIERVTGRPAEETPQVWALYKEVQDYYDQGMEVPADVTLLFADDNWGNVRRLPVQGAEAREGGYGVYYHFDYVGDPRNYKWLNTNQIERTWEQMNLSWEFGARELWIVNVGDLKPMEFPISFFLDQAWNPEAMTLDAMSGYTRAWAAEQFGAEHAAEIAELLARYTRYNSRRKHELIGPETFSLTGFNEAQRVLTDWAELEAASDRVRSALPDAFDDAFVQLVWFPIQASANLTRLHVETGRNRLWAQQGRVEANEAAERVRDAFERDIELERIYHEDVADGKWNHFMSQTHISYTYWQQPEEDVLPELAAVEPVRGAALGLAVEGDVRAWPQAEGQPVLPAFHRYGQTSRHIDLFDRGAQPASFEISSEAGWIELSQSRGDVDGAARIAVSVNWSALPAGRTEAAVRVTGSGGFDQTVGVVAVNADDRIEPGRYVEADGHVTVEAEHFARALDGETDWRVIPNLGRTLSGVAAYPVTAASVEPGGDTERLEYDIHLFRSGPLEIETVVSPTLDFRGRGGLRFAVSIDDAEPVIVTMDDRDDHEAWQENVADSVERQVARFDHVEAGPHTVKLWRVDTGVVFQRVSVRTGALPQTYLGPPESVRAE
ncbi:glycosyl hydrolase 115 family protein [Maricaulis sp.]|uniref:glycosyl hydrolase 115 family protein n=1 Tax=Maricaulis sp. TaxID=1486257 RepID=UPI00260EEDD5|nr:glycosyl hydrolase 115 family protein [Maricaulis sp.]